MPVSRSIGILVWADDVLRIGPHDEVSEDHGAYGRTRSQASHPGATSRASPRNTLLGGTADAGSMVYAVYDSHRGTPGARYHAGVHDVPEDARCRSGGDSNGIRDAPGCTHCYERRYEHGARQWATD